MKTKHVLVLLGLTAGLASVSSFADTIGDPAPALHVKEWVKGKPVNVKDGKNIYVLVFCTLSRVNDSAIASLSQIQKKYQDKGVIAVAISDEPADQLKEFVKLKGAKIEFAVAADNVRRATLDYLRAYQQMKLPRAFVVGKDGAVLWHGHPMLGGVDLVVDEITSGRYNLGKMQKGIAAREQLEDYLELARSDDVRAVKAGRLLLTARTNDVTGLCDLAFRIATDFYIEKRDVALASEALDQAEKLSPTNTSSITVKRAILLFQTGKEAEGLARAREALASAQTRDEKEDAQSNIRAMEARLAAAKASQTNVPARKP